MVVVRGVHQLATDPASVSVLGPGVPRESR